MFKRKIGMLLGILLVAGRAWSSPIAVTNFSFEDPTLVNGNSGVFSAAAGLYTFTINGWTNVASNNFVGTYLPIQVAPTANFFANESGPTPVATGANGVPLGSQVASLHVGGAMYQDLAGAPLGGVVAYGFTVGVGGCLDISASIAYTLSLMTSGTNSTLATQSFNLSDIAAGDWAEKTLYFVGDTAAYAGQNLRVEFATTGSGGQANFDNVRLSDNVPEIGGSAVFWTMFGVAGFWIYRKKRLVA